MSPRPLAATRFRPDVEGLRALAVLLVVGDHLLGVPSGGFVGVDVFFVISGFLITGLLLREVDTTGRVDLLAFYLRRTARIVPAALVVVTVTVAVSAVVLHRVGALRVASDGLASLLMVQNWHLVRGGVSYFGTDGEGSPLLHLWSLAVEEQFYVLWPWLLVVWAWTGRRAARPATAAVDGTRAATAEGRRLLLAAVLVATTASFAMSVHETVARPGWAYFSFQSRAWELGVGSAVAVALPVLLRLPRLVRTVAWCAGLATIVAAALLVGPDDAFPGWAALPVVLGTALLLGSGGASRLRRGPTVLLDNPAMRWVGRLSYSLYLWHLPVFVLLATVWPDRRLAVVGTALTLSLGLAVLTHRFVEQPGRRLAHGRLAGRLQEARWLSDGRLAGATVTVVVLALCAVQLRASATFPLPALQALDRPAATVFADTDALSAALDEAADASTWPLLAPSPDDVRGSDGAAAAGAMRGCLVDPVGASPEALAHAAASCSAGDTDAPRTAVVLGDSIAASWLPGVETALVPLGWRVVGHGLQSCPAVDVGTVDRLGRETFAADCAAARDAALDQVVAERPDLVLLSSALGGYERQPDAVDAADAARLWQEGTARTTARLAASGATVVVVGSPPESVPVRECAVRPRGPETCLGTPTAAWTAKAEAERRAVAEVEATFAAHRSAGPTEQHAAPGAVRHLDVRPWFCTDAGRCPAFVGDALVKVDSGHLSERASAALANVLRDALVDRAGAPR